MMLEKVLKRLCPCYYSRSEDSDASGNNASEAKHSSSSDKCTIDSGVNAMESCESTVQGNWKGALNLVQPQPVYALPADVRKKGKRNKKYLLKPPLYWKKTMKSLNPEGLTVFQDTKKKSGSPRSPEKVKGNSLRHSETITDMRYRSPSASTVEVRWLKSQSLDNLGVVVLKKNQKRDFKGGGDPLSKKRGKKNVGDTPNCFKCQVMPDISHGVILFTAAYFSKKRICLIHLDRLENLSRKGRDGNSYYTVVKLAILPSEKYIKCTKILNNCSSPEVKQDFSFTMKELSGRFLRLSVFDASLQKQHEAVGHALLNLEEICDQPKKCRIKLYRRTQPHVCPGNLALSLKYTSDADKFTILVDRGRNLSLQRDKNVKLNTYVKVSLYSYGEKVKTKKSILVYDSRDPLYNSTFTFQIRKDQMDHLSVSVTVRSKGFVSDVTIGRLNFGPFFFAQDKITPWGRVFLKRELVSHWFRLYL